jgi:hypothetical protein
MKSRSFRRDAATIVVGLSDKHWSLVAALGVTSHFSHCHEFIQTHMLNKTASDTSFNLLA